MCNRLLVYSSGSDCISGEFTHLMWINTVIGSLEAFSLQIANANHCNRLFFLAPHPLKALFSYQFLTLHFVPGFGTVLKWMALWRGKYADCLMTEIGQYVSQGDQMQQDLVLLQAARPKSCLFCQPLLKYGNKPVIRKAAIFNLTDGFYTLH